MKDTTIAKAHVRLVLGDITTQEVDVIVNAANAELAGGGGVDGAIHRVGGPSILEECKQHIADNGKLQAGDIAITGAGNLPASHVVHAVGPKWSDGMRGEFISLERVYQRSLEAGASVVAKSIAFPSISTGAYRFPIDRAAYVALNTVARYLRANEGVFEEVRLVLFSEEDLDSYAKALDEVVRTMLG